MGKAGRNEGRGRKKEEITERYEGKIRVLFKQERDRGNREGKE